MQCCLRDDYLLARSVKRARKPSVESPKRATARENGWVRELRTIGVDAAVQPRRYAPRLVRRQEGSATRSFPPSIVAAILIMAFVWILAPEIVQDDIRPRVVARMSSVINSIGSAFQRRILREALELPAIGLEHRDEAVAEASPSHAAVRPRTTRQNANVSLVRRNPAPEPTDASRLSSSPDGVVLQDDMAAGIEEAPPSTRSITDDAARLELEPALRATAETR